MNLHLYVASSQFEVEAEPKETTLRIWSPGGEHVFNCQVTAASLTLARITAGATMPGMQFDIGVHSAICDYLHTRGFTHATIERMNKSGQGFTVITRKLKEPK